MPIRLAAMHDDKQLHDIGNSVLVVNLNSDLMNHLVFAFPSVEEQEIVVTVVADADQQDRR